MLTPLRSAEGPKNSHLGAKFFDILQSLDISRVPLTLPLTPCASQPVLLGGGGSEEE